MLVGMLEQAGLVRRGFDAGRAIEVELVPPPPTPRRHRRPARAARAPGARAGRPDRPLRRARSGAGRPDRRALRRDGRRAVRACDRVRSRAVVGGVAATSGAALPTTSPDDPRGRPTCAGRSASAGCRRCSPARSGAAVGAALAGFGVLAAAAHAIGAAGSAARRVGPPRAVRERRRLPLLRVVRATTPPGSPRRRRPADDARRRGASSGCAAGGSTAAADERARVRRLPTRTLRALGAARRRGRARGGPGHRPGEARALRPRTSSSASAGSRPQVGPRLESASSAAPQTIIGCAAGARRIRKLRLAGLALVLALLSATSFTFGLVTAIAGEIPQLDPPTRPRSS